MRQSRRLIFDLVDQNIKIGGKRMVLSPDRAQGGHGQHLSTDPNDIADRRAFAPAQGLLPHGRGWRKFPLPS
ncbi:hypothetical protein [Novosphingopyxis iocasae]|uniref:hypothetical protein n=1 Tax=Novosphingopyxis iocasae TaxID=2762729 RepID=UPI0016516E1C|nr:hypothetical protein [Novosphingopyxis iocasae]